jgi:hypothetical protein
MEKPDLMEAVGKNGLSGTESVVTMRQDNKFPAGRLSAEPLQQGSNTQANTYRKQCSMETGQMIHFCTQGKPLGKVRNVL